MDSLIFAPTVAGDKRHTPEARIASLAALCYIYTLEASKMLIRGESQEVVAASFSKRVMEVVATLYPRDVDGFDEVCRFAERHGLQSKVRALDVD